MDVVESQASQETTVTSVTSMMTSDEPKETTMTATSEEPPKRATAKKRRKTAAPLHADVGDRTTLLRYQIDGLIDKFHLHIAHQIHWRSLNKCL